VWGPGGDAVDERRVFLPYQGDPAEPGYQVWFVVASDPGLEAGP
jgi:hypothetical protein